MRGLIFVVMLAVMLGGGFCFGDVESGLVGWWRLDGDASDSSGGGHDGFNPGTSVWVAGRIGEGLEIDDWIERFEVAYSPELNPDEFTVSCWVKVEGGQGTRRSVVNSRYDIAGPVPPPDHRGYDLYINTSNQWCFSTGMAPGVPMLNELISSQQAVVGQWMHVVAVLERGTVNAMTLYVDGNPAGSLPAIIITPNSQSPLRIGSGSIDFQPPLYFLDGCLDDVRVYNRALSAVEAAALHANTIELDVQVDPGGGGSVVADRPGGIHQPDESVQLTPVAAGGYLFDYWSGDLSGSDNPATITMDSDKSVVAHFIRLYNLTAQVDPAGSDSVSVDPVGGEYPDGDVVVLTATGDGDFVFDHWSGDASGSENPLSIVVDSDKSVTANFLIAVDTIIVDDDAGGHFSRIQDAIDAANDGQEVAVMPGTYVENIDMSGKAITLRSSDPTDPNLILATIINGGGSGSVITCTSDEDPNTVIDGFVITNGRGTYLNSKYYGGGMYNDSSAPTVANCTFSNNTATYGGGMCNMNSSSPVVSNCAFSVNRTRDGADGANGDPPSAGAAGGDGGGMYNSNSSPIVSNCTFSWNVTGAGGDGGDISGPFGGPGGDGGDGGDGGGMYNSNSSPIVSNCTFSLNMGGAGGAGGLLHNGYGGDGGDGGAMFNSNSFPIVTDCTFSWNAGGTGGANSGGGRGPAGAGSGIYSDNPSSPTVVASFFCGTPGAIFGSLHVDSTGNTICDFCPPPQPVVPEVEGDVDGDGDVDLTDFAIMAANWPAGT